MAGEKRVEEEEVVIVGAGIAGLALAVALKRVGMRSVVLEKSDCLRTAGSALTLFPNAWRALDAIGVAGKLIPIYQPFQTGRSYNIDNGTSQELSYAATFDSGAMGVRAVHRKALLEALAEELPPDNIRFSSQLVSIKNETLEDSSVVTNLHLDVGAVIRTKILIGCDGVHSVVAQWLGLTAPIHSGRSSIRGLSLFPDGHGFKLEVQQFLGQGKRAGFIPINDKEIYWFVNQFSTSNEKEIARNPELIQRKVLESVAKDFPKNYLDAVRHTDLSALSWAPLMLRRPWDLIVGRTHAGAVAVAGDAFHPMTPDLGQGGAAALEDAVVLARCLARATRGRAAEGIEQYVRERRWRAAGLILGSYVTGVVQQGGSGFMWWPVKLFRDVIFYKFLYPYLFAAIHFDCGVLPTVDDN